MNNLISELLASNKSNRLIIGLDGLSRSGKTTYVKSLINELNQTKNKNCVFHLDDHIEPRSKRYNTGNEEWREYYYLQWNVEYLREELFEKLHEENEISIFYYEFEFDRQLLKRVKIPKQCVIIIEGVFIQRSEWRNYLDYVIYLDCPRETRFLREGKNTRENTQKFKDRYWKAEDFYLETIKPQDIANITIKN
ncbi:kinase [Saccharibacillus endophyticus]|uniref:Uridine kinase n=1 Tax=Saccharibacillus endophyticus TaxID=2060666 RepID=A0ABQ1ZIL1_9BACL|nr:kinase [Saccharibacillus endophyticus]GGH68122.1 uridine kinase [Saccharibacillus endophyticus]